MSDLPSRDTIKVPTVVFTKTHYIAIVHRFDKEPLTICEELLSCSIERDIENPAHGFSLFVKPKKDYVFGENKIRTGDWIEIYASSSMFDKINEKTRLVGQRYINIEVEGKKIKILATRRLVGIIKRAERDISAKDGVPIFGFSIVGESWGKTLVETQVLILPWFRNSQIIVTRMNDINREGSPKETIQKIIDVFYGVDQYKIPQSLVKFMTIKNRSRSLAGASSNIPNVSSSGSATIYDFVKFDFKDCEGKIIDHEALTADSGMWGLLKDYSEPDANELFADLDIDGNPILTLREYPYSIENKIDSSLKNNNRQYFDTIRTSVVDLNDWDILKTGFSETERSNMWIATSMSHPIGSMNIQMGVISDEMVTYNAESIGKYGLKRMSKDFLYTPIPEKNDKSSWIDKMKMMSNIMRHWYEDNAEFLSGSFITRDRFDIKLGDRLIIHGIKNNSVENITHSEEYYTVGVAENWQAFQNTVITCKVCRGKLYEEISKNTSTINNIISNPLKASSIIKAVKGLLG